MLIIVCSAVHIIVNWRYLSIAEAHMRLYSLPFFTLLAGLQLRKVIKGTVYNLASFAKE